jgi:hypothetical protein
LRQGAFYSGRLLHGFRFVGIGACTEAAIGIAALRIPSHRPHVAVA